MKQAFDKILNWKQKHSSLIFYVLMLIWPVTQFLVFYVGVNANSFLLAFQSYDKLTGDFKWVGLKNFQKAWASLTETRVLMEQIQNSMIVWFFTSFLVLVITVFTSYYIYKKRRGADVFKFTMFLPQILPGIILVMIFKIFVNEALPEYLAQFGVNIGPLATLDSPTRFGITVFYGMILGFGSHMLVLTGTMSQISPSLIEAAQLDGITPLKELWYITIPQVMPLLTTYFVTGLTGLFTASGALMSFYAFNVFANERTVGLELFYLINHPGYGLSEYGYASALGLCFSVITFTVTSIARYFLAKKEDF